MLKYYSKDCNRMRKVLFCLPCVCLQEYAHVFIVCGRPHDADYFAIVLHDMQHFFGAGRCAVGEKGYQQWDVINEFNMWSDFIDATR